MGITVLEPDGRLKEDRRLLLVPVRSGRCGSIAVRTGRLPDGRRVGLAFTCEAALAAVFVATALAPLPVSRPERATVAIAPKPLVALQTMTPTIAPTRRRAGARIRLAARHAH